LNKIVATSNNKAKATWEVIWNATVNGHVCTDVTCLKITGKNIQNYQDIVNSFNNFFLDVANITKEGANNDTETDETYGLSIYFISATFSKIDIKENEL
jgi:hypothetical protein